MTASQADVTSSHDPAFAVVDLPLGPLAGVAVHGEVDVATAPLMSDALDHAIRTSTGPFVIDLVDVVFLDSRGIHGLLRARALLGRDERLLALVCPPGTVRRVLAVAGIDDVFALYGSRDQALRALKPSGHPPG